MHWHLSPTQVIRYKSDIHSTKSLIRANRLRLRFLITTGNLASPIVVETVKERGATLTYCFDEKKWRLRYAKLSNFSCNLHQHLHQPFCTALINIHNENVCVLVRAQTYVI